MNRLSLIISDQTLEDDDVRELLDQYVEGFVDDDTAAQIEAALEDDEALRAEHTRLVATMHALKLTPHPEPPTDMVSSVRRRILNEEASRADSPDAAHTNAIADSGQLARPSAFLRWGVAAAAVSMAAAAVFLVVGMPALQDGEGAGGVQAAGIGGTEHRAATITVSGIGGPAVEMLAADTGLTMAESTLVFTGSGPDVARFVFRLRAEKQADVRGFVPDGEQIRLTVELRSR